MHAQMKEREREQVRGRGSALLQGWQHDCQHECLGGRCIRDFPNPVAFIVLIEWDVARDEARSRQHEPLLICRSTTCPLLNRTCIAASVHMLRA